METIENGIVWRDVIGYEGLYQVSNMGQVRSIDVDESKTKFRPKLRKGRILKPQLSRRYLSVILSKEAIHRIFRVHRLVLIAFCGEDPNKPQVNHKNGIRLDNRLENLEWCTGKENTIHAIDNGLMPFTKLDKDKVMFILANSHLRRVDLAAKFGVKPNTIWLVLSGSRWKRFYNEYHTTKNNGDYRKKIA
jgi:hypothetical protein